MGSLDNIVFKKKKFSDILSEIYDNQKKKETQISGLISELKPLINDIGDATLATHAICENEADKMESELSMIRYIIWAIPSIGFIGTVRGIGEALSQAHIAVEGDIAGMTASLGVAFNSTFVALLISILLMFFLHQLQLVQDRLIHSIHDYCDKNLLSRLRN